MDIKDARKRIDEIDREIAELLTEPDLDDTARIKASLTDMITEFESGYTYSGNSYAVLGASSVFSASAMESEMNVGTSLWLYLVDLRNATIARFRVVNLRSEHLSSSFSISTGV